MCFYLIKYDVIVIGSELAGLTASLKLAKSGKKVALFEKHSIPGGYATNFVRKGKDGNLYTFDVSLHSLSGMNRGCPTRELLENLEVYDLDIINNEDDILLIRKGEKIHIPNDSTKYKESPIKRYPQFKSGIENLFIYLNNSINSNSHDVSLDGVPLSECIKKYVNDDNFVEEFCYLWIYIGLPNDKIDASYGMELISRYIFGGHSYPIGGSGRLSKTFSNHIKNNGGNIFLSSEIVKINTTEDKVISVTTKKGNTFFADEFVFACDPTNLFKLIDSNIQHSYVEKINAMEKSTSIVQLYLGLDCHTKDLGIEQSHLFYYDDMDSNESYECFKSGNIEKCNFVAVAYDQLDPDINKERSYLNVAILDFDYNWPERGTEEYKTKKEYISNALLEKLFKVYPKVKDHIQVIELGTPKTMARYTNNSTGSIYGFSQNLKQGGLNRSSFKTPFENAIVVGAWSFPGGDFEGAILSGSLGADRLLRKSPIKESNSSTLIPIKQLMEGLIRKFNPENADGLDITYKFLFQGYDPIYLEIKNKTDRLLPDSETPEKVDTTLSMSHETWHKISFNQLSGEDALMDGLITCEGNFKNFASMPKIFDKEI